MVNKGVVIEGGGDFDEGCYFGQVICFLCVFMVI